MPTGVNPYLGGNGRTVTYTDPTGTTVTSSVSSAPPPTIQQQIQGQEASKGWSVSPPAGGNSPPNPTGNWLLSIDGLNIGYTGTTSTPLWQNANGPLGILGTDVLPLGPTSYVKLLDAIFIVAGIAIGLALGGWAGLIFGLALIGAGIAGAYTGWDGY